MATTSVRKLSADEVGIVCSALELAAKSAERFSKSSANSVIASEYAKQAAMCRNLIAHFKNASIDF